MLRFALIPFLLLCGGVVSAADRPNVLFIFADDQCYDTLRAGGNDEVQTPNLDRLTRRGTTFTRAYNPGGWHGAICVASRTMLNTGLSLWRARDEEQNLKTNWVPRQRLWPQLMNSAGYQTFLTGKWHVTADASKVFETVRHVRGGMPQQTEAGYNRPRSKDDTSWLPWDTSRGGFWEGGKHWSEVVADDAIDYLRLAATDARPFFMYIAFNAPHDPRQAPKEFVDMYPAEKIRIPNSFVPRYEHEIDVYDIRDEKLAPIPRTEWSVQVNRQEYYAIITHMDQQIGRILDQLELTGAADKTWIFFTADHGLACGNHGLMGKQNLFDHSVRVPFIVCGPGVQQDVRRDELIYLQDVMPTSLELAGVAVPESVEFMSLLPLLNDAPDAKRRTAVSGAYMMTQRMITVGKDKLILYPKIGVSVLYDLQADPEELQDLSDTPGAEAIKQRLFRQLLEDQQRTGDPLDLRKSFPSLG
jgi:choline-sulfatase